MLLDRGDLSACVEDFFSVFGYELHVGINLRDSVYISESVAKIQVLVTVAVVSAIDEFSCKSKPMQRFLRLNPFVVVLCKDGFLEFAVTSPVHIQFHMFLAAVKHLNQNMLAVRRPGDIGQILVITEIVGLDIYGSILGQIENTESDIFRAHTVHRIFDILQ